MPTITFSKKDLENLTGLKLSIEQIQELAHFGKGDFEDYNKSTDEVKIDFGDTNLPYLWSVEGFARLLKGIKGKQKGIPQIKINKGNYKIKVHPSVNKIRPYISGFIIKGNKIDDYLIKQLVQLQDKLSDNYGRRRQYISIGLYSYDKIKFPIHYKAVSPESTEFIPLGYKLKFNLKEILAEHPKGKEYGYILKDQDKYPILVDSNNEVLSFPPIINSNFTGKVEEGDENLLFEVTGTNYDHVMLATNIFAYAMHDRGFKIFSADIDYGNKKVTCPSLDIKSKTVEKSQIKKLFGIDFKDLELKNSLSKAHYNIESIDKEKIKVSIPPYRDDILHQNDIIEDIGIMHDYNNIQELPLPTFTIGETSKLIEFTDKVRELVVGLGYQEVMSPMLTNLKSLYDLMNIKDFGTVEIEDYMSENYSVVRSWILPQLLELMSKNKHQPFPQKIFEEGIINSRKGDKIHDFHRIALATSHEKADYTSIRQALDLILNSFQIKYTIEETEHLSFIPGRVGRLIVNNKKVGYIGEIAPIVLQNWGLEMPVSAAELNLTELFTSTN
tara:strand:- start:2196 stop:3863 length:1668 start_codon:yes stop_codon:yes gene_type:complete